MYVQENRKKNPGGAQKSKGTIFSVSWCYDDGIFPVVVGFEGERGAKRGGGMLVRREREREMENCVFSHF